MKFEVQTFKTGAIQFNKEPLKKALEEQLKKYQNLVIADETQVAEFKKTRASLNAVIKSFDAERIRIKKEYCEPLLVFESDVKELTEMIGQVMINIDTQIKYFESKKKEEKIKEIEEIMSSLALLPYKNKIWNDKWLNVTTSIKSITEELESWKEKISNELATLKTMTNNAIKLAELEYEYNQSLDLAGTISRFQAKEEHIKERAYSLNLEQNNQDERKYLLKFQIKATRAQITLLGQFLKDNAIEYEQLKNNEGGNNNGN